MKLNYFNFKELNDQILLTNDFGDHVFLEKEEFQQLLLKRIAKGSVLEDKLIKKRMIYDDSDLSFSREQSYDLRKAKNHLLSATSLHIFVVTTACNQNCVYCQANNGKTDSNLFMNGKTAEAAVDLALQSPSKQLSFEFQGGEPLLNFPVIRHIIEYAEQKKTDQRIHYNLVSNLTLLTDEMLLFFTDNEVGISTSIDGNEWTHDCNRKYRNDAGSFQDVKAMVRKVKDAGLKVGAIETTTRNAFGLETEMIDTYLDMGFDNIFLRPLTPLGKALNAWGRIGYSAEEYLDFYKKTLNYILSLSREGVKIMEGHAALFLRRIFGNNANYMELRSPCGATLGQLAYFPDGNVFTCDEGRMLYEMGEEAFLLGSVMQNRYNDIVNNGICRAVCASSVLESIPSCCDCVYQPFCGTCPVVNYALDEDVLEKHPYSYKCRIYKGMLDMLFGILQSDDKELINILSSWGN